MYDIEEHICHVIRMSVSGYSGRGFEPRQHQYAMSLSKTLYRISSVDSAVKCVPGGATLVKGIQCYDLFGENST